MKERELGGRIRAGTIVKDEDGNQDEALDRSYRAEQERLERMANILEQ